MLDSPFLKEKVVFKRENTFYERWRDFFLTKLDEWFIDFIPSDEVKQMPKQYLYPLGITLLVISVAIFVSILTSSYIGQIRTKYLASSDSSDSQYCEDITIANTGVYLASKNGQWQSSYGFQYSTAPYVLDVVSFPITQAAFSNIMWYLYDVLEQLGQFATTQDLASNLLIWMTFVYADPKYLSQRFYLVADPLNVFDRQKTAGSISNIAGDCTNNSVAAFDAATGLLQLTFSYQAFESDQHCLSIVDPSLVGYTPYANANEFQLSVDVRTLITAMAVNLGYLDVGALQPVAGTLYIFSYNGQIYNASLYANPQFPNMNPVTCTTYPPPIRCVIALDTIVALPVFHHIGESTDYPKPCNCSYFHANNITDPQANDTYYRCNSFEFITGLIFYNSSDPAAIFELSTTYTAQQIANHSYYPMYFGSYWGLQSPYRDWMTSPENRTKVYEFCYSPLLGEYCNFLSFSSFDLKFASWDISPYYYQLTNGACTDSFTTSKENWNKLIEYPFAPLTQEYVKCSYSASTVLSNQAGIAVGNVSILMPFAVLMLLVLVYYYQLCTGTVIPRGYSKTEKEKALEALAVYLLLAKDGKLEQMRKSYLSTHAQLSNTSEINDRYDDDNNDLESGKLEVVPALVKDLSKIAHFSREEYFTVKTAEITNDKTTINWANVFGTKKHQSFLKENTTLPTSSTDLPDRSPMTSVDGMPPSLSTVDGNLELAVVSSLHETTSKKPHSNAFRVLNQTPVNNKTALKYREFTAKISTLELVNTKYRGINTGSREASLDKSFRSVGMRDNTFTSVDLENSDLGFERSKGTREGSLSQQLQPKDLLSLFHEKSETDSQKDSSSSDVSSRYHQEVVGLLLNYWLPRLEKWCEEFKSHTSVNENAPTSATSSSKYWTLSAKMSDLQLLKILTKERSEQLLEMMEGLLLTPSIISSEDMGMVLLVITLFEKIECLLSCHGQAALQCSLEVVRQKYSNQIGYLIGKEVWSLSELKEYIRRFKEVSERMHAAKT